MDQKILNDAVQKVQNEMGDALTYLSVVSLTTGQSLLGVFNNPRNDALVVSAFNSVKKGDDTIGDYTIIDTVEQGISTVHVGDYVIIIGAKKEKMSMGMYMNVVLPMVLDEFKKALA